MTRAVVFDLWDTLAAWPQEDMWRVFEVIGLAEDEWGSPEHRDRRWTGPLDAYLEWVGLDPDATNRARELRLATTRRALVPMDGTLETLAMLRSRGLRLGLISNCSGDVVELWEESPFGGLFDTVVLSADVGLCKPDPAIYSLALERLGTTADETVFVGDGQSRELPGAESVGLRAIQLGAREGWTGERIDRLVELLAIL